MSDYIISADLAIERKSLADLVSSLNSGRLLEQCRKMKQHFRHHIILIELKSEFSQHFLNLKTSFKVISDKLSELIYTIPSVSILWSRNEAHSAQIILRLKKSSGLFKFAAQEILE